MEDVLTARPRPPYLPGACRCSWAGASTGTSSDIYWRRFLAMGGASSTTGAASTACAMAANSFSISKTGTGDRAGETGCPRRLAGCPDDCVQGETGSSTAGGSNGLEKIRESVTALVICGSRILHVLFRHSEGTSASVADSLRFETHQKVRGLLLRSVPLSRPVGEGKETTATAEPAGAAEPRKQQEQQRARRLAGVETLPPSAALSLSGYFHHEAAVDLFEMNVPCRSHVSGWRSLKVLAPSPVL